MGPLVDVAQLRKKESVNMEMSQYKLLKPKQEEKRV